MHAALPSHRDGCTQDMDSCSLLHGHQVGGAWSRTKAQKMIEQDWTQTMG